MQIKFIQPGEPYEYHDLAGGETRAIAYSNLTKMIYGLAHPEPVAAVVDNEENEDDGR